MTEEITTIPVSKELRWLLNELKAKGRFNNYDELLTAMVKKYKESEQE